MVVPGGISTVGERGLEHAAPCSKGRSARVTAGAPHSRPILSRAKVDRSQGAIASGRSPTPLAMSGCSPRTSKISQMKRSQSVARPRWPRWAEPRRRAAGTPPAALPAPQGCATVIRCAGERSPPRAQGRHRPLRRPRRLHDAGRAAGSGGRGGDPAALPRAAAVRARALGRDGREVHRRCGDGALRRAADARGRSRARRPCCALDPRLDRGGGRAAGADRSEHGRGARQSRRAARSR